MLTTLHPACPKCGARPATNPCFSCTDVVPWRCAGCDAAIGEDEELCARCLVGWIRRRHRRQVSVLAIALLPVLLAALLAVFVALVARR